MKTKVDLNKMLKNVRIIKDYIGEGTKLCVVVKGDAYGCGLKRISKYLSSCKMVDLLAVGTINEAIYIRKNGVNIPILALCELEKKDIKRVVEYNIIPTVENADRLIDIQNQSSKGIVKVHVRIDIAIGSTKKNIDNLRKLLSIAKKLNNVEISGVYTHLTASYCDNKSKYREQKSKFDDIVESLNENERKKICVHAASSSAIFEDDEPFYDMVRIGAAIYGLYENENFDFQNIVRISGIISSVVDLDEINGYSYNGFKPKNNIRRIAKVMSGYEDAVFLAFSNSAKVVVNGEFAQIVEGGCFMDSTIIDVSHIENVQIGDEVVFLGKQGQKKIGITDIVNNSSLFYSNNQLIYKFGRRVKIEYINENMHNGREILINQIMNECSVISEVIKEHGEQDVNCYLESFCDKEIYVDEKSKQEVKQAIEKQLNGIIPKEDIDKGLMCIENTLLTANHHGIDTMAQCVQGNYIYSNMLKKRGINSEVIPVVACSTISVDNSSYAKGLLVYDTIDNNYPLRIPIIPNKYRKAMVGMLDAIKKEDIKKTLDSIKSDEYTNRLKPYIKNNIIDFLNEMVFDSKLYSFKKYIDQATYINYKLSKKLFGYANVYISLEQLSKELLIKDLRDKTSLIYAILNDEILKKKVVEFFDGVCGCWDKKKILQSAGTSGGSVFFWTIRDKFKRCAFTVRNEKLISVDDCIKVNLNCDDIIYALNHEMIIPSLFVCFLTLAFQRGFLCFGGYFQPEYLSDMKEKLVKLFGESGYENYAKKVSKIDCYAYISGFIPFVKNKAPMGIFELMGQVEQHDWLNSSLKDLHINGLNHIYMDVIPNQERIENWKEIINCIVE